MRSPPRHILVLDVGKTHLKIAVADRHAAVLHRERTDNLVRRDGPYPHYDLTALWSWFTAACRRVPDPGQIDTVVVTTHGAAAALIAPDAAAHGLALPVLDYEYAGVRAIDADYAAVRPSYAETCSPALPGGLNLGRQLRWLQSRFPVEFAGARWILPYPQYFAWRLSGVAASEVTSLGCHTDLWQPREGRYSSLVAACGWAPQLAPLRRAGDVLGNLTPEVARATGLRATCRVLCGIHDSNAAYLRFLGGPGAVTPVSTGTWAVTLSAQTSLDALHADRDMLANVDVHGRAVACARFMGGREMAEICRLGGSSIEDGYTITDLGHVIRDGVFALPEFSGGSGPFGGSVGRLTGAPRNARALAALYAALVIDYELELLAVRAPVVLEGSWLRDAQLAPLLATLTPGRAVHTVADGDATVSGCVRLANPHAPPPPPTLREVAGLPLPELAVYKDRWRSFVAKP